MRPRCIRILLTLSFCLAPLPSTAQTSNGSIGIFADPTGEETTLFLPQGVASTLYIVARLDGDSAIGLLGAEFRITGMPDSWVVGSVPNPLAAVSLGDPFSVTGGGNWRANIAFSTCMGTEDGTVVLYTVTVLPTTQVSDQVLSVEAGAPPSNPNYDTPLVNICDPPLYTVVPVDGRTAVINPVALLPDPAIAGCDIQVSNSSPVDGEAVFLHASVRNLGSVDLLTSVVVRFLMDGVPLGDDLSVGPIPVGSLAPVTSTVSWNVDFALHQVTVIVDPDSLMDETSELNNSAAAALPYDLRVKPVSACVMFSTCDPCVGDTIVVNAEIQNLGLFDVDSVDVEYEETAGIWSARVLAENIAAGSGCSTGVGVSVAYFVAQLGSLSLTASVDPDDVLPEPDENNNSFTGTGSVSCVTGDWHDYRARSCDIVASDPSATTGTQILLQATVTNVGGRDGDGPTTVRFALDGQPLGADVPLPVIPAGDSIVVSTPWTVALDPQQLTVLVDPDSLLLEFNRSNNQAAAVLPYDFSLQTVFECPGACCPGDTALVSALVSNAGLLSADSVLVRFTSYDPPGDVVYSVVPHVPAKTYCSLPVPTTSGLLHVLGQDNNEIGAFVDPEPGSQWPELDENNNWALLNYWSDCGQGTVDLVIVDVQYTLASLEPGSVLQDLTIEVSTGGADLTGVTCVVLIDWVALCAEVPLYPTSTPGRLRGTCPTSWVVPEPPGVDHQLLVCVDVADVIPELDEDNNCLLDVIQASGSPTPVSLTGLQATSIDDGVELRWLAQQGFAHLGVDRRLEGQDWQRLEVVRSQRLPKGEYAEYHYIDRSATPGQSYDYRIVGIGEQGNEVVLGELSVQFSPPIANRLVVEAPSPNPFNPSTRIRFSIPQTQHVEVRILDSTGRLVKRLWDAELGPGRHDLTWHGLDARGSLVPSGIYYCSVRTRSEQQNRKMVLIK
jgi:hypothetical protein